MNTLSLKSLTSELRTLAKEVTIKQSSHWNYLMIVFKDSNCYLYFNYKERTYGATNTSFLLDLGSEFLIPVYPEDFTYYKALISIEMLLKLCANKVLKESGNLIYKSYKGFIVKPSQDTEFEFYDYDLKGNHISKGHFKDFDDELQEKFNHPSFSSSNCFEINTDLASKIKKALKFNDNINYFDFGYIPYSDTYLLVNTTGREGYFVSNNSSYDLSSYLWLSLTQVEGIKGQAVIYDNNTVNLLETNTNLLIEKGEEPRVAHKFTEGYLAQMLLSNNVSLSNVQFKEFKEFIKLLKVQSDMYFDIKLVDNTLVFRGEVTGTTFKLSVTTSYDFTESRFWVKGVDKILTSLGTVTKKDSVVLNFTQFEFSGTKNYVMFFELNDSVVVFTTPCLVKK